MVKKIDRNLYTSGTRSYKNVLINGNFKLVVVAWTQKRCERCGRFAGKYAKKYCKRCAEEIDKKWFSRQSKEYRQDKNRKQYERELKIKGRKQLSREQREYYHSIPFDVRSKQNNERKRKLRNNKSIEELKILNKREYKSRVKRLSSEEINRKNREYYYKNKDKIGKRRKELYELKKVNE